MASHETFLHAIKQLELRHSGRLKETEGQREIIRKVGVVLVWSGCGLVGRLLVGCVVSGSSRMWVWLVKTRGGTRGVTRREKNLSLVTNVM